MVPMVGKSVIYPLSLAPYLASVEMFDEIEWIFDSKKKCYNLLFRIYFARNRQRGRKYFEIINPSNQEERASQLSVLLHGEGRSLFEYLMKNGVITDWREPNVIRLAPVPLYSL
jgi:kynureninase